MDTYPNPSKLCQSYGIPISNTAINCMGNKTSFLYYVYFIGLVAESPEGNFAFKGAQA